MKKNSRKLRRVGRGAILLVSVMLVSSAFLRLGTGAGVALAQALTQLNEPGAEENSKGGRVDGYEMAEKKSDRKEMGALLRALLEREQRVKTLETQIDVRSRALALADEEISKRLAILEQAEVNLRRTLSLADGAAEDDLARLTAVYENMKPKDASALFETMKPDFAAGFMGRMRPDAAAAIMAGLTPEVAYSISVILAGRNAEAPKT